MGIVQAIQGAMRRFLLGGSRIHMQGTGFMNRDEPSPQRQRRDYRGAFYRCITIRANAKASALLKARVQRRIDEDTWEDVEESHPWVQFIRRPNPSLSGYQFWKWVSESKDLLGHAHSIVWQRTLNMPDGVLPVFTNFGDMNPVPTPEGFIGAWQLWRADGRKIPFAIDDVFSLARQSPFDRYKTFSLIQAALFELDVDLEMKINRRDTIKDGGVTATVLSSEQRIAETNRKIYAKEYKEFLGRKGIGKVTVMSEGLKPLKLEQTAKDLQYIQGLLQNTDALKFITGVPEALFAKEANRANVEAAERVFIQHTIQPEIDDDCDQITTELEKLFDSDPGALRVAPPELMPLDEELDIRKRESKIRTGQATLNEFRQEDGKELYPPEIGDRPMIAMGLMFLEDLIREAAAAPEPAPDDPEPDNNGNGQDEDPDGSEREYEARDFYEDVWRRADNKKMAERRRASAAATHMFDRFATLVLSNLDEMRSLDNVLSVDKLFEPAIAKRIVDEELRPAIMRTMRVGFEHAVANAKSALAFELQDRAVRETIDKLVEKQVTSIVNTTTENFSRVISQAMEDEAVPSEVAKRIRGFFTDEKQGRVNTIAQTVSTSSFESAQQVAFDKAGITRERWVSQRDGDVRPSHRIADGQEIDVGAEFTVGDAGVRFPGDPDADAPSETIGCRCTVFPILTDD